MTFAVRPVWAFETMNWAPGNATVLAAFIRDYGRGGSHYHAERPPYAVFDWDQTSAFLDCGEATLRYQTQTLQFKLPPEQFQALLKPEINGVTALSKAYGGYRLADIHADLLTAYRFLYDNAIGPQRRLPLAEVQKTPQYQDFISKLPFLYEAYCETPGIGTTYGYPWITYLFANFSEPEVRAVAKGAIESGLGDALRKVTWTGPAGYPSACGPVSYSFKSGLRVHPEMQSLMAALRAGGIDVYVVSASLKQVVEVFAGPGNFGYAVPADHVIGMETAVRDGKLQPVYKPGWVQTQRAGKVEAIKLKLGSHGEPVFGAGDSDGDVEMLTQFPGMKLSVILNRLKGGDIGALCERAAADMRRPGPRFLLQGRNENTGLFIPTAETIGFGQGTPSLLKGR